MDDWISLVYGKMRTFKARSVQVIHHTGAHGQRYEVDRSHERMLESLVESGRRKIRTYMMKTGTDERHLKAFDLDEYKAGWTHIDVPKSKYDNR